MVQGKMSNELSDEAFERWIAYSDYSEMIYDAWQECRRRAEVLIETERRKAFEAGWDARGRENYPTPSVDGAEAYRAYTEATKEDK